MSDRRDTPGPIPDPPASRPFSLLTEFRGYAELSNNNGCQAREVNETLGLRSPSQVKVVRGAATILRPLLRDAFSQVKVEEYLHQLS